MCLVVLPGSVALLSLCPAELIARTLNFKPANLFWHHRLPASNWLWEAQHKGVGDSCISLGSCSLQLGSCSILASLQTEYPLTKPVRFRAA